MSFLGQLFKTQDVTDTQTEFSEGKHVTHDKTQNATKLPKFLSIMFQRFQKCSGTGGPSGQGFFSFLPGVIWVY